MSVAARIGGAPAGVPWEERPAGSSDVVWRSSRNPVIPRDLIPRANSIFNSAVVPYGDGFAGVFRVAPRDCGSGTDFLCDDGVDHLHVSIPMRAEVGSVQIVVREPLGDARSRFSQK